MIGGIEVSISPPYPAFIFHSKNLTKFQTVNQNVDNSAKENFKFIKILKSYKVCTISLLIQSSQDIQKNVQKNWDLSSPGQFIFIKISLYECL